MLVNTKEVHEQVIEELLLHCTPEGKRATSSFMPGEENIVGVRMPVVNEMAKIYRQYGFDLLSLLWDSNVHEQKILAVKILKNCIHTL